MSLWGKPSGFGASTTPFGQSTTTTGFGQTANQSQTQNQPQSSALGGGLLGGSTLGQPSTNAFGASLLGQPQAQQQPQQQLGASGFMNASQAPVQRSSLIWEPGRESLSKSTIT